MPGPTLVAQLEALLANPADETLKAQLVEKLSRLDAGQAKAKATRNEVGDITREQFRQSALACLAANERLDYRHLRGHWPDATMPDKSQINRLIRDWLVDDGDWPGPISLD